METNITKEIVRNIRCNLTQSELSAKLNGKPSAVQISQWENGRQIKLSTAIELCAVSGKKLSDVLKKLGL